MRKEKVCPLCNTLFVPSSSKQTYCKRPIVMTCACCGDTFSGTCSNDNSTVCSKPECKKRAASIGAKQRIKQCRVCGQAFTPASSRQVDCNRPKIYTCEVCGKPYEGICSRNFTCKTCSDSCSKVYQHSRSAEGWSNTVRVCEICGEEFQPVNNTQRICKKQHVQKCKVCGKEFEVRITASHYLKEFSKTCSPECRGKLANMSQSPETRINSLRNKYILKFNHDISAVEDYIAFTNNPRDFIEQHFSCAPTLRDLSNQFHVAECTVGQIVLNNNCSDLIQYDTSKIEQDIKEFIMSIDPNIDIMSNTRKIISPYEIDIYLPEYRVGIECNPTATHNSSFGMMGGPSTIPYNYHKHKTDRAEEEGIFLFHLFGYEWAYKKDIMKSMITNLLGKNSSKIYARNCEIVELSAQECAYFLDVNHRQGNVTSKVRLGLRCNNTIVAAMTFGPTRTTIGRSSGDDETCWELLRFCSALNTTVIGGADKLFKHFVYRYNPNIVRSFSDRARTRGGIYAKLGFRKVKMSDPGYVWVDTRTDVWYTRVTTQKHNLHKLLHDDSIDLSKTEKQIMEEHGYAQIFDSGTVTWEWRPSRIVI